MEVMSDQIIQEDGVGDNLPEADQENVSHTAFNEENEKVEVDAAEADNAIHQSDETNDSDTKELPQTQESKENATSDNPSSPIVQSTSVNDGAKVVIEPELKLEGIEGKEGPVVQPAEIELLSQHKSVSDDIENEIKIHEINDNEETSNFHQEDTFYEQDQDDGIGEVVSPEYRVYDRESLQQQYKEALEERVKIQIQNQQLQHKLAEYFKKKKTDDRGQEIEKNVNDQEQRYLKYMSNLEELQKVENRQDASIEIQLEEMQRKCTEMENKVEEASNEFIKFKYEVAAGAINSRSGKHIPANDLEQYKAFEAKKEQEVIAVRLENIKLKNRLKKREQQLKAKEELAEGLHLIDFEQLKIENQTYHEKIEERNEELLKLRKKITTTVQVLTHLKEKLQFVQGENAEQRGKLRDIEVTVAQRRDILTRLKQVRDALRIDNNKLKHKAGLLGNKPLLRDYEIRKDEGEELHINLETLKQQHVDLNLSLQGVKKKIEKSKPIQSL